MPFGVLHGLPDKGEDYLAEVASARAARKNTPTVLSKKTLKGETLRETQPRA